MHLDPKALDVAIDAALSRYNDDTAPRRCESWREHLREMTSDAIRAYLSASIPAEIGELVTKLEAPALGLSHATRQKAASALRALSVRNGELERALEFYAEGRHYNSNRNLENGKVARAALLSNEGNGNV